MGYSTDYEGKISIEPPVNEAKVAWLNDYFEERHAGNITPHPGCPGIWCDLVVNDEGDTIEWNGNEKTYELPEWFAYLIREKFAPDGHILNGTMSAQGEDPSDKWLLVIEDNVVSVKEIVFSEGATRRVV